MLCLVSWGQEMKKRIYHKHVKLDWTSRDAEVICADCVFQLMQFQLSGRIKTLIVCRAQSAQDYLRRPPRRPSCLLNKRTNGGTDVYFPPTNPNGSSNSLLVSIKALAWRRANQLPPEPVYFPWWFTESRRCGAVALLCLLRRRLRLISHNKVHIWLATVPVVTVFF